MTESIKAKGDELIKKFIDKFRETDTCFAIECKNVVSCQLSSYYCEGWLKSANQCAIIAVEEIIKVVPMYTGNLNPDWSYWNEVLNYLKSKL